MSDRLRVAFAVLAGYYLGRRRKVRMAAALAAAGLAGKASNGGPLAQGVKALGSAVELQQLTDRLRGELVEIGKQAVVTAATRQIDSLSERLQERAGGRGDTRAASEQEASEDDEEDYQDEGAEDEGAEEEGAEEAAEQPARHKKRPARAERSKGQRKTRTAWQVSQSRG